MMLVSGNTSQLPPGLEVALATYRHRVFVDALQWQLPVENGLERDQFDRDDTLYVVARGSKDEVCGCARLLPTTRSYLLDDIFPELMNGLPAPHSHDVWELSRFSTMPVNGSPALSRDELRVHFCALFAAVVEIAMNHGAARLITVTALGVERILRSIGIHAHRVGPPRLVDGKPTLAMWVELDEQTCRSLQLSEKLEGNSRQ